MIAVLVWIAVAGLALPFVAYPILLLVRATLAPRPFATGDATPSVDLLIAAHDEAASIEARLENALALDYPRDRLTIWVASDGSSDDTVSIAKRFEDRGVRVLDLPRGGKAAALIAAAEASSAEVLAFTDANSHWLPSAMRALVAPLADPQVGGVAGDQRYVEDPSDPSHAIEAAGETGYWRFDRRLKRWASRSGNAISATGAIYAIRRDCFEPPPPDATDDFMISTGVIARGRRLVFSEDAVALEPPSDSHAGEFRRKVRIITRGLRGVYYRRGLLDPRRTGLYAFELLVHKLLRRLTWIPLLALVLLAPFAVATGGPAALPATAAFAGVAAGLLGEWGVLGSGVGAVAKTLSIARFALRVQTACAVASWNAIRGHRVAHWQPERAATQDPEPAR